MADIDISVGELPEAEYFDGESILLVENQGIAERVSGAQIKGFLRSGNGGGGGSGGGASKASELENDVPFVSAGDAQTLTDAQKEQARVNIGAATVEIEYQNIGSASFVLFDITDGNGKGHHLEWNQDPMKPKDGGVWVPQFNEETSMLEWDYYQADELYPVPMPTPVGIPIPDKTSDLENDSEFVELPTMQQSIQQVYDTTNVFIPQNPTEEQKAQARENIGVENVLESVGGDTLEWDGNTEGLVSAGGILYKLSDAVPTLDDLASGLDVKIEDTFQRVGQGNVAELATGLVAEANGLFASVSIAGVEFNGLTFPETGFYLFADYVQESTLLTIPGYTGFVKKQLKEEYIPESVPQVQTAAVGQTIVVSEVDAEGKPTKWEAVEFPAGGGGEWRQIADVTLTEEVCLFVVEKDMNGDEIHLKEFYVLLCSQVPTGTAFKYIKTTVGKIQISVGGIARGQTISSNASSNDTGAVRHYYCYAKFIKDVGCMTWHGISKNLYNQSAQMQQMLRQYNSVYLDEDISRIVLEPDDGNAILGGVGTTVKIWGLDA